MRYLINKAQYSELKGRQIYLYDIFKLYFITGQLEGSYIPLIPVGTKGPDVLFIIGHTNWVIEYLSTYIEQISEHYIVITSCMGYSFKKFARTKEIYVPDINRNFCPILNGKAYGFEFDITDVELNFYNASGSIEERIRSAYHHL